MTTIFLLIGLAGGICGQRYAWVIGYLLKPKIVYLPFGKPVFLIVAYFYVQSEGRWGDIENRRIRRSGRQKRRQPVKGKNDHAFLRKRLDFPDHSKIMEYRNGV